MKWRHIAVVVLLGVIVLGAVFNGALDNSASGNGLSGAEYDHAAEDVPFEFTIERTTDCGAACREVTTTLVNTGDDTASDVTVSTILYAGENTTASNARLWEEREDVGTLEPGESYTSTTRVDLSLEEASQLSGASGWVTIRTTVEADEGTIRFLDSKQVA